MKTYKVFAFAIVMVISFLFANNVSAQYWRLHVQGISFLVPKGIVTDNTAEGFSGEHKDFDVALATAEMSDPSGADNLADLAVMLTASSNLAIYENSTKELNLKAFKGLTFLATNGDSDFSICIMSDIKKKNLYIVTATQKTTEGIKHIEKLFSSFE